MSHPTPCPAPLQAASLPGDAAPSTLDRLVGVFTTVRPGEGRSALLFFGYSSLLLFCYYVLKTIREPLLLGAGSAALKSYAYAAIAAALVVLVPLYGVLFRRAGKRQVVRGVTVFFTTTLLLFYVLARAGVDVGFVYYVWVGVFGVVMLAQFWAHAAHTYKVESGQRLFPVIMAGAAVGAVAGPPLCGLLFEAVGPSNLMLLGAGLLAATVPLVERTWNAVPPASRNGEPRPEPVKAHALGGLALVLRDRYLLLLAVLAVLLNCVSSTGDYVLTDLVIRDADRRIAVQPHLDRDGLIAAFYGNYYFAVNALGVLLQLCLVSRLFRWVGVPGALLVVPAVALLGYGLVAFVPVFAVVQAVKLLETSTNYTLMNTARHALYLPLPAAHQYEGKTTIDGFFWRCGDLLHAALIYVGLNVLGFGFRELALVNALLAAASIAVALRIGRRYAPGALRGFAVGRRALVVGAVSAAFAAVAVALPRGATAAEPLFASHEPLAMELRLDGRTICRDAQRRECEDSPATIVYRDESGTEHAFGVRVRARGKWRNDAGNCSVPPLFVFFPADGTDATPFAGQEMLPLTTHCREKPASYEQYVLKEYLAYRIYNVLTEKSLRVRLVRVTYRDLRRDAAVERYAFFTEHFESLAARHGAAHLPDHELDPAQADAMEMATLELFQYLIGNTDWSELAGHNVTHLRAADGSITPVPFDFDFSGLVNASYAGPPPGLPIRSVRQRLFRGLCHAGLQWDALFAAFAARRGEIDALTADVPGLADKQREEVRDYLEQFFDVIGSPERRRKSVIEACRAVN